MTRIHAAALHHALPCVKANQTFPGETWTGLPAYLRLRAAHNINHLGAHRVQDAANHRQVLLRLAHNCPDLAMLLTQCQPSAPIVKIQ